MTAASRFRSALFLVPAVIWLALAWPGLGSRILHTDEAVNAAIVGGILEGRGFDYQSQDHHGPAYFALSAVIANIFSVRDFVSLDEAVLRSSAVASGLLVIVGLACLAASLGFTPVFLAALLWSVSPLALYFGRYAIHETLFVAFSVGLLAALLRWQARSGLLSAASVGVLAGLLLATKETAIAIFAVCAVSAIISGWRPNSIQKREGLLALGVFSIVVVQAFTWGFQKPAAIVELARSFPGYLARAGGQGHEKSVFYYFELLFGSPTGLLVAGLAILGLWAVVRHCTSQGWRFLGVYAVGVVVVFSVIPYKNPWLALNLWWPLLMLAGFGLVELKPRWLAWVALGLAGVLALQEVGDRVYRRAAEERNPYAYAHTSEDLARILPALAAKDAAAGREVTVAVLADDPWPLPWLLRGRTRVGYWSSVAPLPDADVWIVDAAAAERNAGAFEGRRPALFGQRPGVLLVLYGD